MYYFLPLISLNQILFWF